MILSIGLDISKQKIDYYSAGIHAEIPNTRTGIKTHFKTIDRAHRVVMEATGKYHRLAHRLLAEMGFSVMIVNPYQSKHFAKSLNLHCKTDKVDAKVLSIYAEKMDFTPTQCSDKNQEAMQELSRHLDDLKKIKIELELRLKESEGFIAKSLKKTIKSIEKEIKMTEEKLRELAASEESMQQRLALLLSIPGIGETTAIYLLSCLKELGKVNKREIAALTGLAPMNNDSGKFKGKRRIKGGRHDVRSHLYMPTLGAVTRHNQKLKGIYNGYLDKGKAKKVALTACMRKMIIWANAILASGKPWCENQPNLG